MTQNLSVSGDTCELRFDRFDLAEYRLFLKAKIIPEFKIALCDDGFSQGLNFPARFAHMIGAHVEVKTESRLPLPDFLFDDQKAIVEMALDAKRFAVWKDCGLGKTLEQLEWSRQVAHITGGRVLIITLNEIVDQTIAEARKFYGDSYRIAKLDSRQEMRDWCAGRIRTEFPIAITNYEKLNPTDGREVVDEMRQLGGIALDESSRLKTGGGKQKWAVIKSTRGVPYKTSFTATPAPNDVMEFASQASFLERIRDENDVIWTYFSRNPKTNEWTVKKHARPHFFRWMASWSIYVADPRAYGWRKDAPDIPLPEFFYEEIEPTAEQIALQHATSADADTFGTADLFGSKRLGMVSQLTLMEAAKGFLYTGDNGGFDRVDSIKPAHVARVAKNQLDAGLPVLIWCEFDAEVELISEELRKLGVTNFRDIGGKTPKAKREPIIQDFIAGNVDLLVSKSKILGFGRNFQNCKAMIFSGFSDSFEAFYQAVRRAYRYGQKDRLKVFMPYVSILEGPVLRNLLDKCQRFSELIKEQEAAYLQARRELN